MNEPEIRVPSAKTPEELEAEQVQAFEERFDNMVMELMTTRNWPKRKARKFLESQARRAQRKMVKQGRSRRAELEAKGELIDVSDLSAQLDAEFEKELAKAGLSKADLEPMVPADEWPDKGSEQYEPPTRDF